MEEELNYITVAIKEKPKDPEIIYEEVTEWDREQVLQENQKKALPYTPLCLVAAGLGIICVIFVAVVITLSIHLKTVMSEQSRESLRLTEQNLLLMKEKADLEGQTDKLTRERDGLNWTIGVILQYDNFQVRNYCTQKVCRPCLDGWVPFQSKCYLFSKSDYSFHWKTWQASREVCRQNTADLVVIESWEEQKFINDHTEIYHDEIHGYWIGLKNENGRWMWADGSNVTVMYWNTNSPGSRAPCVLSLPHADALANWQTKGCQMYNRYICETRALVWLD